MFKDELWALETLVANINEAWSKEENSKEIDEAIQILIKKLGDKA